MPGGVRLPSGIVLLVEIWSPPLLDHYAFGSSIFGFGLPLWRCGRPPPSTTTSSIANMFGPLRLLLLVFSDLVLPRADADILRSSTTTRSLLMSRCLALLRGNVDLHNLV